MSRLVRQAVGQHGAPRFLITDHGTQFGRRSMPAMGRMDIRHVKGRVRAPYLNGKMERAVPAPSESGGAWFWQD